VTVSVPVEVLIVSTLIDVAVATPNAGVVNVGEVRVLLVRVCVAPKVTTVSDDDGKVIVVESVPARVIELLTVKVLLFAIVKVALLAGAVIVTLFIVVAVAAPKVGVVKL
jgi:hypothetical protein